MGPNTTTENRVTIDPGNVDVYWPEPILSPIAVRDWFKARIKAGEPASLIRIGDGELAMLGYGAQAPWAQTSECLQVWFGRDDFDPVLLENMARQLRQAVRRASVVGLPRPARQRRDAFCSFVADVYDQYQLRTPGQLFTDCALQRFWQMLLAYRDLIADLPFLGVVTSRDLGPRIGETFNIRNVVVYPVPSEHRAPGVFDNIGPHFPERFEQLCAELAVPYRGAVFIVGAGALGKIYADIICQRGGIAIDAGSVLDGWAGTSTRDFLRRSPNLFGLDSYRDTAGLTPDEIIDRYRTVLRSVFFAIKPSAEEFEFLEN